MTSYITCINCAADKNGCARRAAVRTAIKGAGVTSVKFRCADRQSMFRPGQRVGITWTVGGDGYELDETWPATVIAETGTRFLVHIDDVESDEGTPARDFINNERLFVKVSPSRLRPLDEPDRTVCKWCQRAPVPGQKCPEALPDVADIWPDGVPPYCVLREEQGAA